MGRRSINTTKSGKYMNPTDQARKEARKRELKKNKKQRQMVRAAVLKGKDPHQLIADMEKIDQMEFNVNAPPPLNEKVLKDKRKKLKETWERVLRLYQKEDPEHWLELRRLEEDYERKRNILVKYYESVKFAQQVQVDEIPLPATPNVPQFLPSQIPLPSEIPLPEPIPQPQSILKKIPIYLPKDHLLKPPPGVPPGPPPELSDDESDKEEIEEPMDFIVMKIEKPKQRKIRFADEEKEEIDEEDKENREEISDQDVEENIEQEKNDDDDLDKIEKEVKLVSDAGGNISDDDDDQNTEEMLEATEEIDKEAEKEKQEEEKEEIEEKEEAEKKEDKDDDPEKPEEDEEKPTEEESIANSMPVESVAHPPLHAVPLPAGPPPGLPPGPPPGPPPMMFRPPPLRPGLPPPPRLIPPGVPLPVRQGLPPGPPPGLPPRVGAPPLRLPPGPPPGIPPPRLIRPPGIPLPGMPPPPGIMPPPLTMPPVGGQVRPSVVPPVLNPNVLSAPPSLIQRPKVLQITEEEKKRSATIEAKPQIRSLSADIMRFMPTTLRVKREDRNKKSSSKSGILYEPSKDLLAPKTAPVNPPSKDDAYEQFLKEMEGLL